MSDYEIMRRAEQTIAAAEAGEFDAQFGVTPEQRALLTRAAGDGPLTLEDARALNAMGREDLTAAAHIAGRFEFTTNEEN